MRSVILGCGYSGLRIARALAEEGEVLGTRRDTTGLTELERHGVAALALDGTVSRALGGELERTTHLISSVAPARTLPLADPMLDLIAPMVNAGALPALRWIGYLSTIGVYGDHQGDWVDERAACTSLQPRSIARREAELAWQALGERVHVPVAVLRLAGIYGPGRNAVRDALLGRARMLIKPGQVFNRIHVDDLARATALAARQCAGGIFNIADDVPAAPEEVIRHAHALAGRAPPPAVPFDEAELSPMARSFYAESKRVDNTRSKQVLGLRYRYPDFRLGLASLLDDEREAAENLPACSQCSKGRSCPTPAG